MSSISRSYWDARIGPTFAEDLKTLVDKAYLELQDDSQEQLVLTHYLGQLEQQQLPSV